MKLRWLAVPVLALLAGTAVARRTPTSSGPVVTVYKSPSCGCCAKWIDHMRAAGFTVNVHATDDLSEVMSSFGVPSALGSCHTASVGGYVIEGHVPADLVKRLLAEHPAVTGLAVPGMVAGSPGMEQGRAQPYDVIAWDKQGHTKVYVHQR